MVKVNKCTELTMHAFVGFLKGLVTLLFVEYLEDLQKSNKKDDMENNGNSKNINLKLEERSIFKDNISMSTSWPW